MDFGVLVACDSRSSTWLTRGMIATTTSTSSTGCRLQVHSSLGYYVVTSLAVNKMAVCVRLNFGGNFE